MLTNDWPAEWTKGTKVTRLALLDSNIDLVPPTCTSAVLEGLETGNLYTFRIYAENAAGMSEALLGPRTVRIREGLGK
jgi:hypothetical protein